MSHWASQYIGRPWRRGAAGPQAYDCWGLVRAVYAEQFGCLLPAMPLTHGTVLEAAALVQQHPERNRWQPVATPAQGDIGLLTCAWHPSHVGLWIEADGGGVLHAQEKTGVVFQPMALLKAAGWGRVEWLHFSGGAA